LTNTFLYDTLSEVIFGIPSIMKMPFTMDITKKKTILVAEDVGQIREMVEMVLQQMGYEVIAVPNGQAGLEAFREKSPDLIISDNDMPLLKGVEFSKLVRAEKPEALFILMSGGEKEPAGHMANRFIFKPITLSTLKEAVTSLLS